MTASTELLTATLRAMVGAFAVVYYTPQTMKEARYSRDIAEI